MLSVAANVFEQSFNDAIIIIAIIVIEYYTLKTDQPIYRTACAHTALYTRKCYKNNGKKVSRENSTHCYVHKLAIGWEEGGAKLRQLNKSMCSSFTSATVICTRAVSNAV